MLDAVQSHRRDIEAIYPLSPMQQGMLFHSLFTRHSGVDIEQVVGDIREKIDSRTFAEAWRRVVGRHAVLRTGFEVKDGAEPRQIVHREAPVRLEEMDWSGFNAEIREARLEEFLRTDRRLGFDPAAPPLLRLALICSGDASYRLVFTFHHLLLDGRALALVLEEAFTFYEALSAGREPRLPAPRPYRAYIDWLKASPWTEAEAFWRERLNGFATLTPLPMTRSPGEAPAGLDPRGETGLEMSPLATARLYRMARQSRITVNILLQGAWALLLSHYSSEDDVIFGAIRACRRLPIDGADSTVGLFINTVPIRARVEADAVVEPWLQALRSNWRVLRKHEHTPLVKIHGWSGVPSGRALFDTLFNFQAPSWYDALRALGGSWDRRRFRVRNQSNYPLVVDACGGEKLVINILFNRRRFADDTITRLLEHYRNLIETMAANPRQKLGEMPVMTENERRQVLVEWNQTATEYPREKCIHELFEARARAEPGRTAVADARGRLTYGELNRRANRLARRLVSLGIGPDAPVCVAMERSVEMVVAWLGILKAGGAFVPLDPAYPRDRLAFLGNDCRASVWLTQPALLSLLPQPPAGAAVLTLVPEENDLAAGDDIVPAAGAKPENLAYVIYTSGSTGRPKGVQIEHRSLVNLVTWHQRAYRVTPDDRALHLASPAFDASVWEIWPYLTAGASVHIPDEDTRLSPERLPAWLQEQRITLAFLPTPLAEAVMDRPWPEGMALRALLTGGEKLNRRPPDDFPCAVVNHYGPTENTVVTTWARVPTAAESAMAPPIGRPIANHRVYVLDRRLRPVPVNVPGELYVSGAGLARGYLNRPELDAEKFIADPFAADGGRLYRTGDWVRWNSRGSLEFLGRIDHQVKLRGHRIELSEIEAALDGHRGVRQAVVTLREDGRGKRLVAYLVPAAREIPAENELRRFLARRLPAPMVPAQFVWLERLPLTAHGKVDRQALPEPGERSAPAQAPSTVEEAALAKIWREVLGLKEVGAQDDFFELGGHSLSATQALARVRSELGTDLPLRALFENPTLSVFAGLVRQRRGSPRPATRIPRRRERVATVGPPALAGSNRK